MWEVVVMRKNLYLTFDKLRLFLKDSHEEGEYEYLLDHINRLIRGQEEGARLIGNEDRFTKGARKLGKQEITYLAVLRMYALEKKQQLSSALKIENISSNQQSEIWSYIGDLYYLEGIYDEAISCYDRAISFGGDVGILDWCCFQKYYIFSLQGKTDKADKFLERINDTSSCWTLLGNYYVEPLKEPFRALECFDNAIDLNEKNVDAYVLKSKTLKSLGKK
jgi:tetratricopeptide (TPR) repeat protein